MIKKGGQSVTFPDQEHGWVARGDLKKPEVLRDVDQAAWREIEFI